MKSNYAAKYSFYREICLCLRSRFLSDYSQSSTPWKSIAQQSCHHKHSMEIKLYKKHIEENYATKHSFYIWRQMLVLEIAIFSLSDYSWSFYGDRCLCLRLRFLSGYSWSSTPWKSVALVVMPPQFNPSSTPQKLSYKKIIYSNQVRHLKQV